MAFGIVVNWRQFYIPLFVIMIGTMIISESHIQNDISAVRSRRSYDGHRGRQRLPSSADDDGSEGGNANRLSAPLTSSPRTHTHRTSPANASLPLRPPATAGSIDGSKSSSNGRSAGAAAAPTAAIFATENSTVAMAQVGGTATLPCVVRKFNSGVVSWIRKDKTPALLLTVGLTTYSADDRVLVEHIRHLQNWGLLIKHVQPSDEGLYECQVSTHPPTSIFTQLKVTEASAEIVGAPDLHLHAGSTLQLVCKLRHSTEPPTYVFWFHEHRMINYDEGVVVVPSRASSILRLPDADTGYTGNYTCSPSNAIPASINVHVLNATEEENPAAMLHNSTINHQPSLYIVLSIAVIVVLMISEEELWIVFMLTDISSTNKFMNKETSDFNKGVSSVFVNSNFAISSKTR